MILIFIFVFISYISGKLILNKNLTLNKTDNEGLEIFWTLFPGGMLLFLAIPSIQVLYSLEEIVKPTITTKVISHQWYWSYEFSDFNKGFDSFIIKRNRFRLLLTDNHLVLPIITQIRGLVSSDDVIHSWSLPPLGIKIDANPGRINIVKIFRFRRGVILGQCSEICGVNHAFMPITVEFVTPKIFNNWVSS